MPPSVRMPHSRAMWRAVWMLSPVTMRTVMPASWHVRTASGTSRLRGGLCDGSGQRMARRRLLAPPCPQVLVGPFLDATHLPQPPATQTACWRRPHPPPRRRTPDRVLDAHNGHRGEALLHALGPGASGGGLVHVGVRKADAAQPSRRHADHHLQARGAAPGCEPPLLFQKRLGCKAGSALAFAMQDHHVGHPAIPLCAMLIRPLAPSPALPGGVRDPVPQTARLAELLSIQLRHGHHAAVAVWDSDTLLQDPLGGALVVQPQPASAPAHLSASTPGGRARRA
jgi:hypothetical protein